MSDELLEEFPLDEDWEPEYDLTKKDSATRKKVPATGLTGIKAWISTTEDGATIHSSVSADLSEAASKPGTYFGLVDTANLLTNVGPYTGSTVYKVLDKPGDFRVSTPVKVVRVRSV